MNAGRRTLALAALLALLGMPEKASSLPAFARQTGMNCQSCHVAYPRLNPFGKTFRDRGYTLQDLSAFQGPWEWKDFFPVAHQGVAGFGVEGRDVEEGKFEVQAFQIFAGGPIGPNLSAYLHHHLVMNDGPGELHEAWVRWTVPGTPVSFRIGKFELPLANSPGKTLLTHFEPKAYEARLGMNPDQMVSSKHAFEVALNLLGHWTAFLDLIRETDYRAAFARIRRTFGRGEAGLFVQAGEAEIEPPQDTLSPVLTAGGQHVTDRYAKGGLDFDLFLNPRMLLSGAGYYASQSNPHGDGDPGEFVTGYMEWTYIPSPVWLAGLRLEGFWNLKPEEASGQVALQHVGAETGEFPDKGSWLNGYSQFYLSPNVKVLAEYLYDAQSRQGERSIVGVHYAF